MQVLILGYGEMGHAMESLLHSRHRISIWDKYPPDGMVPVRLEEAVPAADVILFCLPASPHR
jgi:glycerol-3-phosphate dehydrogenase (NAD(P)+)